MKTLAALFITLLSFSAFSASVDETIAKIETDREAVCSRTGISAFNFCTGPVSYEARICYSTVTYSCYASDEDFTVKLRVKESQKESKVTKVTFSK